MKVIIIGAGLGGLACAITCRQEGIEVLVLERAPKISAIGAGIQVSANASRIVRRLGCLPAFLERAMEPEQLEMRRWNNGKVLYTRPGREPYQQKHGSSWFVIHRADYHEVMLNEATRLGVQIRLGCAVEDLDFEQTEVMIEGGERLKADVIVGADGLWSTTRSSLLGCASPPIETGDLAYRATLSRVELESLHDPSLDGLLNRQIVTSFLGPDKHCVFYAMNQGKHFNLVLFRPDNMSAGERTTLGDVGEMRASFEGWDSRLTQILSKVKTVTKWKLLHHEELERWTRNNIALLGDACHPTLPYQGQGAAMAVEDGATLARVLGLLMKSHDVLGDPIHYVPEILRLYETIRKARTTLNVQGASNNRYWYHLDDGSQQEERDKVLSGGPNTIGWTYLDPAYQKQVLGFDAVEDAERAFAVWLGGKHKSPKTSQTYTGRISDSICVSLS